MAHAERLGAIKQNPLQRTGIKGLGWIRFQGIAGYSPERFVAGVYFSGKPDNPDRIVADDKVTAVLIAFNKFLGQER